MRTIKFVVESLLQVVAATLLTYGVLVLIVLIGTCSPTDPHVQCRMVGGDEVLMVNGVITAPTTGCPTVNSMP